MTVFFQRLSINDLPPRCFFSLKCTILLETLSVSRYCKLMHGAFPHDMVRAAVSAGTEPHSRAYLSAKGIRDIASGLFAAMLIAYGSAHALGWFMLIATIIPIGDAAIVSQQGGRRAVAFGVHGGTAAAMVIISGLLLFD